MRCGASTPSGAFALAAALEAGNEHPIARALRSGTPVAAAADLDYRPGYGVTGTIDGRRYRLGSARHVGAAGGEDSQCVYLADEHELLARIELTDTLRPHAREALAALDARGYCIAARQRRRRGRRGPRRACARSHGVARGTASSRTSSRCSRARQQSGAVVAAVGDGINDAPLLAQADVSVALVAGSRLAQASADVVFTGDDLRVLARLPDWAAATRRVVRQNLVWAAVYNLAAVPLAAAGLLAPWMAAIGMSLSSLVVVGNALRLSRLLADPAERTGRCRRNRCRGSKTA